MEGSVAEQWRIKNPFAFVEIVNESGELCACFGLLDLPKIFVGNSTPETQLIRDFERPIFSIPMKRRDAKHFTLAVLSFAIQ